MLMQRKGPVPSSPCSSSEMRKKSSFVTVSVSTPRQRSPEPDSPPDSNGSRKRSSAASSVSSPHTTLPTMTHHHVPTHVIPHVPISVSSPCPQTSSIFSWPRLVVILTTACIFAVGSGQSQQKQMKVEMESLEQARLDLQREHDTLHRKLQEVRQQANDKDTELHKVRNTWEKEKHRLENMLQEQVELVESNSRSKSREDSESIDDYIAKGKEETTNLQLGIQRMARAQAIEHFGKGPHYVEFETQVQYQKEKTYFTIELASLDLMPASVNFFLNQVSKGLWDSTSFFLTAEHVAMVQPVHHHGLINKHGQFRNLGLDILPFAEYSDQYPHVPHTIGFADPSAGPIWYINKIDNTEPHGPQGHRADGAPEPCFGKIIIGSEFLNILDRQPRTNGQPNLLALPVAIVSARIRELRQVHGGMKYMRERDQ